MTDVRDAIEASDEVDAIVVGAGLSGVVCATRLVAAGARVIVLEASDRIGGRLQTGTVGGVAVDLGGQYLSVGQPRLLALARELGAASAAQPREGAHVIDVPRRAWPARFASAVAQWRGMRRIRRLIAAPPPGAAEVSLAAWFAREIRNPTARSLLALHAELVLAVEPAAVSLACYLARLGATGDFAPRGPDLPGGGREHVFVGGAHGIAGRLADALGDRVRLPIAVHAIAQTADEVRVRTSAGALVARHVVLAIPPRSAREIEIEWPAAVRAYFADVQAGPVVKCFAAYDRAFWRDAGWSGQVYLPTGDVRAVVPIMPAGAAESEGATAVLLAFLVGAPATAWPGRDPVERRAAIVDLLVARFGEHAARPVDYVEADWSAGCVASLPPGSRADEAAWRAAHGRIHIAGTESATSWPGYMEGAIEAGERAATEILAEDLAPAGGHRAAI